MTAPEQAAEWSIATGYMGVSPAAYETEALKAYTAELWSFLAVLGPTPVGRARRRVMRRGFTDVLFR